MAKTTEEKIFIGIDDQVIELTGKDKELFLTQKAEMEKEFNARQIEQEKQKALKVSAYTKLGLTEEEINAIL
jgi:hypothetical protein